MSDKPLPQLNGASFLKALNRGIEDGKAERRRVGYPEKFVQPGQLVSKGEPPAVKGEAQWGSVEDFLQLQADKAKKKHAA